MKYCCRETRETSPGWYPEVYDNLRADLVVREKKQSFEEETDKLQTHTSWYKDTELLTSHIPGVFVYL